MTYIDEEQVVKGHLPGVGKYNVEEITTEFKKGKKYLISMGQAKSDHSLPRLNQDALNYLSDTEYLAAQSPGPGQYPLLTAAMRLSRPGHSLAAKPHQRTRTCVALFNARALND